MKKLLFAIPLAVGALAFPAPEAHADRTFYPSGYKGDHSYVAYWRDLNAYGVPTDQATAIGLATAICTKMHDGASEETVIALGAKADGVTPSQAEVAVFGAEYHFCPEYY